MNILPTDFSSSGIWSGISQLISNVSPLIILLITIILGFGTIERIVGIFKKNKE